jgi:hypothetical protein
MFNRYGKFPEIFWTEGSKIITHCRHGIVSANIKMNLRLKLVR